MSSEINQPPTRKFCIRCHKEFETESTICPDDGTQLSNLNNSDNLVGTTFDNKYEILSVIGGGAMGTVYKARHCLMDRIVAIKVLHANSVAGINAIKRFQIEARAASALSMPNITALYDFGTNAATGKSFMVMDYLDGRSLLDEIESQGKLSEQRAVHIFKQLSQALAHAHEKGIIHRDVKPSNMMLVTVAGDSDFVKLVDFGIAKLMDPADSESNNLTAAGEVFGTVHYMSPEQCRGAKLDARTDIYSLGAVMYFALAARPMFEEDNVLKLIRQHVMETPTSLRELGAEISEDFEAIVFKALAKDVADRYQSMNEMTEALDQYEAAVSGAQAGVDSPSLASAQVGVAIAQSAQTTSLTVPIASQPTPPEPLFTLHMVSQEASVSSLIASSMQSTDLANDATVAPSALEASGSSNQTISELSQSTVATSQPAPIIGLPIIFGGAAAAIILIVSSTISYVTNQPHHGSADWQKGSVPFRAPSHARPPRAQSNERRKLMPVALHIRHGKL